MTQRLPTISRELIEAVASGPNLPLKDAVIRMTKENPSLVLLADTYANQQHQQRCELGPVGLIALVYELLHRQADVNFTEEHC